MEIQPTPRRRGLSKSRAGTVTKDIVIRLPAALAARDHHHPAALRRDYERINNLGFFEKVDLNPKPGPDPKKPYEVTLDWNVKEHHTADLTKDVTKTTVPEGRP